MVATYGAVERRPASALQGSQDLSTGAEAAFAFICEVEKWPVWLSFARTVRRLDDVPLRIGSEVALRSVIPGDEDELYEVDRFLDGHIVSLVGAYSLRRRIDFRVERKGQRSKLVLTVAYPAYGGLLGSLLDRMTVRRKIERAIDDSLVHFKALVEFKDAARDEILADF